MKSMVLILLVVGAIVATAQQQAPQPPNQPLELPEFVVTGKERVDIPAGAKHAPAKPPAVNGALLDSLNDLEKQPMPTMPLDPVLRLRRADRFFPGYATLSLGQYLTPAVSGGYTMLASGYRLDAHANVEASSGHVDHADYFKLDLRGLSTYVAPEKFIVFGGSTTEADLRYRRRDYSLFAVPEAPSRGVNDVVANVEVDGKYEGYRFNAGANWSMIDVATSGRQVTDNAIEGHAAVDTRMNAIDLGGRLDVNLRSYQSVGYSFVEGSAYGRYSTDLLRFRGSLGLQSASATRDVTYGGLLVQGVLDVFINEQLTMTASVRSGLQPTTFRSLLYENAYVGDTSLVLDVAYDVVDVQAGVVYHPHVRLTATAAIRLQQRERHPVWISGQPGLFDLAYEGLTIVRIPAQLRWIVTGRDVVTADVEFVSASVRNNNRLPYQPNVRAAMRADRTWGQGLASTVALIYVGDRWADLDNTVNLSGYIDLRASVRYDITQAWQASIEARNLLASDIVVWNGYIERGLFVNATAVWRF